MNIDEILINGEAVDMAAKGYTTSDDDKCTRVNLYNQWVSRIPEDGRTADGSLEGCSASILEVGDKTRINTISVTFTLTEAE